MYIMSIRVLEQSLRTWRLDHAAHESTAPGGRGWRRSALWLGRAWRRLGDSDLLGLDQIGEQFAWAGVHHTAFDPFDVEADTREFLYQPGSVGRAEPSGGRRKVGWYRDDQVALRIEPTEVGAIGQRGNGLVRKSTSRGECLASGSSGSSRTWLENAS